MKRLLLRNLLAWSKDPLQLNIRPAARGRPHTLLREESATLPLAAPAAQLTLGPCRRARGRRTGPCGGSSCPGLPKLKDKPVLVRMGGQERTVILSRDKASLSFDVPVRGNERRLSYAVYGKEGRSLARGSLVVPAADSKALPERPFSFPGESAAIRFNSIGKGQVTIEALGFMNDQIISDKGTMSIDVPHDIPAGTYPVQWLFESIQGDKKPESFPLDIGGYRVAVEEASVTTSRNGAKTRAVQRSRSGPGRNVSGQLQLVLTRPDAAA